MALKYRQFYKPEKVEKKEKEKKEDKTQVMPAVEIKEAQTVKEEHPEVSAITKAAVELVETTKGKGKEKEKEEEKEKEKDTEERSFAIFAMANEWYAVDLDNTLEILHNFDIVTVPHLPETFLGVTNLRGESVPVIDLKVLLNAGVNCNNSGRGRGQGDDVLTKICLIMLFNETKIGFLIDSDVEIINATQGKLYPLPDCFSKKEMQFLEAIFWMGDRFIGILKPRQALEVLTNWEPVEMAGKLSSSEDPLKTKEKEEQEAKK